MVRFALVAAMAVATVLALPQPQLTPDPNGEKNVGNGQGQQFITGACLSNADCASGCCAVLGAGGICSGPAVSFAQGKQGCGFGGNGAAAPNQNQGNDNANGGGQQQAPPAPPAVNNGGNDAVGSQNLGNGRGLQFITGLCSSDADCASACCAGKANGSPAACAARAVAFEQGRTGCGFGGAGNAAATPDQNQGQQQAPPAPPAPPAVNNGGNDAVGSQNLGNGRGLQFITGLCSSDADCASACCAGKANGSPAACAARAVAFEQGRTGCGFSQ